MCEEKYANAERPDIIILDLNLPKKTGLEVLKEIKGKLHLKHIPVIVMTTSNAEEDIENAYAFHANCYIIKPIDFEKFSKVIKSIIDYWSTVVTLKVSSSCKSQDFSNQTAYDYQLIPFESKEHFTLSDPG